MRAFTSLAAVSLLWAGVAAQQPRGGAVHGRILLAQQVTGIDRRPSIGDFGQGQGHGVTADQRRSVVYLETAPRGAFEDRSDLRALIDQRAETFVPHVLAIMVGTTVEFLNSDRTYHNVFSLSRTRSFDLGRYPRGQSKFVRFDRPGIVRVFCEIHSHMSAFILVFSHRFFAVADAEGRYRIDNVPAGSYTVAVWNESMPRETRRVTLDEDGKDVELNVTLGEASSR
jgi:plastocyanin